MVVVVENKWAQEERSVPTIRNRTVIFGKGRWGRERERKKCKAASFKRVQRKGLLRGTGWKDKGVFVSRWIREEIRGHRTRRDRVRLGPFTCVTHPVGESKWVQLHRCLHFLSFFFPLLLPSSSSSSSSSSFLSTYRDQASAPHPHPHPVIARRPFHSFHVRQSRH